MLDGEVVCLDDHGRCQFNELLFGRGEPRFYAFDLLPDIACDSTIEPESPSVEITKPV